MTLTKEKSVFHSVITSHTSSSPDVNFKLAIKYKYDDSIDKVNLCINSYRDDFGKPIVFKSIQLAKEFLIENDQNNNHEYLPISGLGDDVGNLALKIACGIKIHEEDDIDVEDDKKEGDDDGDDDIEIEIPKNSVSVQTLSGTGAIHLAALFISKFYDFESSESEPQSNSNSDTNNKAQVYVSEPTWINHIPIFEKVGLKVEKYPYYNANLKNSFDFRKMIEYLKKIPNKSIIILQSCCHNPTGIDPSHLQWIEIYKLIKIKKLFPIFDIAFQGFSNKRNSILKDSWIIKFFISKKIDFIICQSFSKIFGLYGERTGFLHFILNNENNEENGYENKMISNSLKFQLSNLIKNEFLNPPSFGIKLISIILKNKNLYNQWLKDLKIISKRLSTIRNLLKSWLQEELKTPGSWDFLINQNGIFSYIGLSEKQIEVLVDRYHVYLPIDGKISFAGLNSNNVEYFARSIDKVVREIHE